MGVGAERVRNPTPLSRIRDDIPILESIHYLNSASCSPLPRPVIQAMTDYYDTTPINYRSGRTPLEREVTNRVDAIRDRIASHLGAASSSEIVITKNTTEGINIVAGGLSWAPDDEVVATPIEHQSNLIPWMRLAHRSGVRLRYVQPGPDGRVAPEDLEKVLSRKTRLVAIHHVSNLLGTIQDVTALAQISHGQGAMLLLDAAQSEGRIDVHVPTLGCDFLVTCGRKGLMGPQGVGILWARQELLRSLDPIGIGGQSAQVVDESTYRELDIPFKHEAGILNTAGVIGLGAALEFAESIGLAETRRYTSQLTEYLLGELAAIEGVEIHSPFDPAVQAGIVSWSVNDIDPLEVADSLFERRRIVVAAGTCGSPLAAQFLGVDGVVRSSIHHFNNVQDIDELVTTLHAIVREHS